MTSLLHIRSSGRRRAFTLVELLVVIGILVVLMSILLPVTRRARQSAQRASCATQVREIVTALTAYSNAYHGNLPWYKTNSKLGQYMWDVPTGARDKLMEYGLLRKTFYCPANPDQNSPIFWPYHTDATWTVTGYFFYIPRPMWDAALQNATYGNTLPNGQPDPHHQAGQLICPRTQGLMRPAEYELVSDAVIATNGSFNVANEAIGTSTSHIDANKPTGGNVGFHDGHVEWRPFDRMYKRLYTTSGYQIPDEYW